MEHSLLRHDFLSRRQFVGMALCASGVATGSRLDAAVAQGTAVGGAMPKPIPRGTELPSGTFIHHRPPKSGGKLADMEDPSQITDFEGHVGICRVFGEGTETNTETGETSRLPFAADMGFMKGEYVREDGRQHDGTFAFL